MPETPELHVNAEVILEAPVSGTAGIDSDHTVRLEATVVELQDQRIWLKPRQKDQRWQEIQPGCKVRLKFWNSGGIYFSNTEVLEARVRHSSLVSVNRPGSFMAIQRRQFFRMELDVPFAFCVVERPEEPLTRKPVYRGTTTDISGGGMSFTTALQLHSGALLVMHLVLDDTRKIRTLCRVTRCQTAGSQSRPCFEVGAVFLMMEEKLRRQIIRYIFQEQLAKRKKSINSS